MAPAVGSVTPLHEDRVRVRRWQADDTDLATVIRRLHELQAELTQHDASAQQHPHPRNCVLNLVVTLDDQHRVTACDRLVGSLAASHPLRAILIHPRGGRGTGALDAEITSEAHHLMNGFPVQREQVLLQVRGDTAEHLISLVVPLLVPDVPTYLWWSGRHRLEEATVRDAMTFSDVLVVDSARFEHPVDGLLQLAVLVADPDVTIGVADFRWGRLRPWRDAIAQFFGPADRRALLTGLREVTIEAAGAGPDARVGAALLAGWMASSLGWPLAGARPAGAEATGVEADAGSHHVHVELRSVPSARLHHGELLKARLAGGSGRRTFTLAIERDPEGGDHAHLAFELDGGAPVLQLLTLPRLGDPELLVNVLWASWRDPVFLGALRAAATLLEAMR